MKIAAMAPLPVVEGTTLEHVAEVMDRECAKACRVRISEPVRVDDAEAMGIPCAVYEAEARDV